MHVRAVVQTAPLHQGGFMSQNRRDLVQVHQNATPDGGDAISINLYGTRNIVDVEKAQEIWRQLGLALSEARANKPARSRKGSIALLPAARGQFHDSGSPGEAGADNDAAAAGVERLGGDLHAQSQALQRHLGIASGSGFVGLDENKGTWMVWIFDAREQPQTTQWAGRPVRYLMTGSLSLAANG